MPKLNESLAIPVATIDHILGRQTESYIGSCYGLIARSTGFSKGFSGSIKALRKGKVEQFTETLEEARRVAVDRMVEHAQALGGNAVVGLRFDSTDMGEQQGMAEIVAYGTAIVIS
ncbi:MAG: heavy metal-binding domain-containing protein [Proteobacteria bacterium]|nr:heavy metal-binding domain-containing protein [Pseudomonadota bacterium]